MSELCPVFVMNSEEIVDVFYVPLEENGYGGWSATSIINYKLTGESTHTIIETPIGCFEWRVPMRAGYDLNIYPDGNGHITPVPCQRISSEVREHVAQV